MTTSQLDASCDRRRGDSEDNEGRGLFMRHDKGCKQSCGGGGPGARLTGIRHTQERGKLSIRVESHVDTADEEDGTSHNGSNVRFNEIYV